MYSDDGPRHKQILRGSRMQRRFKMGLPVLCGRFGNKEKPQCRIVASSTGTISLSVLSYCVRRMATLKAVFSELCLSSQRRFCCRGRPHKKRTEGQQPSGHERLVKNSGDIRQSCLNSDPATENKPERCSAHTRWYVWARRKLDGEASFELGLATS